MKKLQTIFVLLLLSAVISLHAQQKPLMGYTAEAATVQFGIEEKFDSYLKAEDLDQWMKHLTAHPHHLGSAYGKANAEYLRDLFSSWGFDAKLETYKVLFPTPKLTVLEMIAPTRYAAKLSEPEIKEDATSGQKKEQLPVYNAWSADGDVTAELIFVNYGVPADYETLERLGIDVKGKIVIAKYGASWRGIKPKVAQEHGAIGCIIYSDPKEDGYYQGDVYPKGSFRNEFGVQRGSVLDMPIYPGDPLTPEKGATENATRIDRLEAVNLLKIPVLPISYSDALPLLSGLTGAVVPPGWAGALPITYHIGPGPAKVHLKLAFDWKLVDCYDVIARLTGSEFSDEWVVRGNHHDAWVNGAGDPISGLVAELAEAKALGALLKTGWKPKRTIVYCAWDGEEPGLIGSTEWVEDHAAELQKKAVSYINSDGNGRGFLSAGGSHTLQTLMDQVARDVQDPQTGVSVFERSKSHRATTLASAADKKEILSGSSIKLDALGSGSDYSGFLQHLAVPSLDIGYGGESPGGEYHSIYDSYDKYKKFEDGKFAYGVTLSKTTGRVVLRLANATVLPFDFKAFQKTLSKYVTEVITLADNLRESTDVENQLIRENRYVVAADPQKKYVPGVMKDPVPFLNFSSLQNAAARLEKSAAQYADVYNTNSTPDLQRLNALLFHAEQKLITPNGLPRRPWYKHSVYAPGFYTGYGVKTLPGIREAIEQRSWKEAQEQIELTAAAIMLYAEQVEAASKILTLPTLR